MFDLQDVTTVTARSSELERFIEFWVGPRLPDCGVPSRVLSRMALPEPLRRLYHFAGRWIPSHFTRRPAFAQHMFSAQDTLLDVDDLETTADGKLVFLVENQAVWKCATECTGDDPPVWMAHDRDYRDWELVHGSLSEFLTSYVLQELLLGSRHVVADEVSLGGLQPDLKRAVPLWKGSYVYPDEPAHQFSLIDSDLLVGTLFGTTRVAANSERGLAKLKAVEGEINRVHVQGPEGWYLEIVSDGSGKLGIWMLANSTAHFPPGTFAFESTVARLAESLTDGPTTGHCAAYFFRRGQGGGEGKPLANHTIVIDLIATAAHAAVEKEPLFDVMFRERTF